MSYETLIESINTNDQENFLKNLIALTPEEKSVINALPLEKNPVWLTVRHIKTNLETAILFLHEYGITLQACNADGKTLLNAVMERSTAWKNLGKIAVLLYALGASFQEIYQNEDPASTYVSATHLQHRSAFTYYFYSQKTWKQTKLFIENMALTALTLTLNKTFNVLLIAQCPKKVMAAPLHIRHAITADMLRNPIPQESLLLEEEGEEEQQLSLQELLRSPEEEERWREIVQQNIIPPIEYSPLLQQLPNPQDKILDVDAPLNEDDITWLHHAAILQKWEAMLILAHHTKNLRPLDKNQQTPAALGIEKGATQQNLQPFLDLSEEDYQELQKWLTMKQPSTQTYFFTPPPQTNKPELNTVRINSIKTACSKNNYSAFKLLFPRLSEAEFTHLLNLPQKDFAGIATFQTFQEKFNRENPPVTFSRLEIT